MGAYTSIRGWIEVYDKSLTELRLILTDHVARASDFGLSSEYAEFYNQGWIIPDEHINWTHYIFYGADIRTQAVDFIHSEMESIAKLFMKDDDIDEGWGFYPTGLISIEEDGTFGHPNETWNIDEGTLTRSLKTNKENKT